MKNINSYEDDSKLNLEKYESDIIKNKEIIRCINCNELPIIDIIPKNNNILIICPIHQNNCDYTSFLTNCLFKCPICFQSQLINSNICNICKKNYDLNNKKCVIPKCLCNKNSIKYYCRICRKYLCDECKLKHDTSHPLFFLSSLCLNRNEEIFIENNLNKKELILNNIIKYINNIPNNNTFKEKGNQLLILLEEKKKERLIEKFILMNYKQHNQNYSILVNAKKLLDFEKNNFTDDLPLNLNQPYDANLNKNLNYIRSYLQNGYKKVECIEHAFSINNFKDNKNIHHIHNKNIKSIIALNESLVISGSWDCFIKIYNIYINQKIYSIEQPSMIFNLKKYPLIKKKINNNINNYGILVCLYCEISIINIIQEQNSSKLRHSTICNIRGFGNFIWTAILLEPNKKIIAACLDNRLSAHKLLPNDTNTNEDINYCLINSNMNKEKETITSLLQIDEQSFVSSSSLDLNDDPSIKFWHINDFEDEFILEKAIYDIYCCQYPNSICKLNKNIIGFALEYASLSGKTGGIALIDFRYKEIFAIVNTYNISCMCQISENRLFTCGYDRNTKKRFLKEFILKEQLEEIGSLEIYHYDDIINIEILMDNDLMIIGSDEGKITVFDNYSPIS